ncbi:MAG: flavodoxin family protein [Armatimonadetes bacterium]|nr:flavodoxin family protein [Armatimonadota bacterium]
MKIVAVHGSPNVGGLTESLALAALEGAAEAGAETELIRLTDRRLESCRQCDDGWGQCRRQGRCIIDDDFQEVRTAIEDSDAWVLVSPVYYWDFSECVKVFIDRLRRCARQECGAPLADKPFLGIAAAGGTGNGIAQCLVQMDYFAKHTGAQIADLITATRRSREYKIQAARAAGRAMTEALKEQ